MLNIKKTLERALRYHRAGNLPLAEKYYKKVLKIQPKNANALHLLGFLAYQSGKNNIAKKYIGQAIFLNPGMQSAYYNLGNILKDEGMLEEAIENYQKTISLDPSYSDAYNNLGIVYQKQEKYEAAIINYKKAISLNPNHTDAYNNFGTSLHEQGNFEKAITNYKKAISLNPNHVDAYNNLGITLGKLGKLNEAINNYEKAIEISPFNTAVLNNLGEILLQLGKVKEAINCHQKAIEIDPSFAKAYYNLMRLKPSIDGPEIKSINQLLEKATTSEKDREFLQFSLAHVFDRFHNYEKAFFHVREANALRKKTFFRGESNELLLFESVIENFTKAYFETRNNFNGIDSELPVFIVGMPRSGTTLVEQIISSHPFVHGGGELRQLPNLVTQVLQENPSLPGGKALSVIDCKKINDLANEYLKNLKSLASDEKRITDKMPRNYFFLGLIALMFPKAKIIHCKRNPLDTCLSCFFLRFTESMPFSYDLKDLGEYYLKYEKIMDHWHKVLPIEILNVEYENVVENQEEMSRKLISFVGLEWDEQCLQFYKNKRRVDTASNLQVRMPIYKTSMDRWKNYEKFLGPLKVSLGLDQEEVRK